MPGYLRYIDWFAKPLSVLWLALLGWLLYLLVAQIVGETLPGIDQPNKRRAYFYTLGLTITGLGALLISPLVLVRTFISERQAQSAEEQRKTAEQTHFTTLYSKAIQQLGENAVVRSGGKESIAPAIEVRIGAIYALERIAKESDADYRPIVETLCAYVRRNSGPVIEIASTDGEMQSRVSMDDVANDIRKEVKAQRYEQYVERADIRAAMSVLMRRSPDRRTLEGYSTEDPPSLYSMKTDQWKEVWRRARSLSADELHERFSERWLREYRELHRKRFKNMAGFLDELDSWKSPNGDAGWTVDLSDAVLQGMEAERVDFRRITLRRARLEGAWLEGAQMQGANLEKARLQGAYVANGDLRGATLEGAWLTGVCLFGADMDGVILSGSRLDGATFTCAKLGGAELDGANAEGADFGKTQMEGAYFGGANLKEANFRGADLEGAEMGRSAYGQRTQAAMGGAAHLLPVWEGRMETGYIRSFLYKEFGAADLTGARLKGADLAAARMDEARLQEADLSYASLRSADLSKARGLTQEQVNAAFGDGSVLLPDGIDRPQHWRPEALTDKAYYGRFKNWVESNHQPWPYLPVFDYWANVNSIPFESSAVRSEIATE